MIIDNFALTMFQACPAKYDLRIKQRWTTRRKSSALGFGGALHEGLAAWYKTGSLQAAVLAINDSWPVNVPVDDYRTKEKCITVMIEYTKEWPMEPWTIVGAPANPMIEVVFTLDTGLVLDDGEPIQYGGIFDGLVEFGDVVYVLEHKTTSQMGAYYFNQFKPNNQITGYVWAAGQLSNREVGGAFINAIGVYKASATKFDRQITSRSPEEVKEWLCNLRNSCQQIRDCERRGYFPMHTPSCTMYGKCEFHDVHVMNPVERYRLLEQDYVQEEWSHEARAGTKEEASG